MFFHQSRRRRHLHRRVITKDRRTGENSASSVVAPDRTAMTLRIAPFLILGTALIGQQPLSGQSAVLETYREETVLRAAPLVWNSLPPASEAVFLSTFRDTIWLVDTAQSALITFALERRQPPIRHAREKPVGPRRKRKPSSRKNFHPCGAGRCRPPWLRQPLES